MRARSAADVQRVVDSFLADTGWHPSKVHAAAGALMYSKYNFLIRFIMRAIARKEGANTDTSQDHEFTDWAALDHVIDEVSSE
jgi:menaquinone-dependent protoporphyrinogen oxidase